MLKSLRSYCRLESLEKEGHVLHIDSLWRGLADARHAVALSLFPGEEQYGLGANVLS